MSVPEVLLIVLIAYLALVALGWFVIVPFLCSVPDGKAITGLLWWSVRIYCRLWHRAGYVGAEILPKSRGDHNGLIVISNHTGAVDPLVIQTRCRFAIRWLMATDTMLPELNWLWKQQDMIPVRRDGTDSAALREAIRHARAGGVVGIFPEGRITTPPRQIRPFLPGVGFLITRSRVPVLVCWVSGTPDTNNMHEALSTRSNARVEFIDIVDFGDEKDGDKITEQLRQMIADASGWPLNDEVQPVVGHQRKKGEFD